MHAAPSEFTMIALHLHYICLKNQVQSAGAQVAAGIQVRRSHGGGTKGCMSAHLPQCLSQMTKEKRRNTNVSIQFGQFGGSCAKAAVLKPFCIPPFSCI